MSEFYHEFTPGFNYWYVVGPAMLLVILAIGSTQYHLCIGKIMRIRQRFNERFIGLVAIIASVALATMIMLESGDGIIQFCDNHLTAMDSGVYSLLGAAGIVGTIMCIYWAIAFYAGKMAGEWKFRKMIRLQEAILYFCEERAKRNKTNTVVLWIKGTRVVLTERCQMNLTNPR